ncbi:hypothetical protein HMPREF3153_09975 [Corynebacterium sp. HMSC06C06]|jgi:hypothetical protein|uniref:hypothetical protein n=1 Tax=Corynebacterium TaxID=1716 RepID=UPI0008A558F8|nr:MULTISPECIES: hypothetical protein [Corynebacterium]MDV2433760.1 hypothetical protein [Corynebacterium tuberculostearicum]OFT50418.1 hypothetical protein HMPREF3153_09975 [Corynebacterium sp. HMSC06C06]HAT1244110.1 hypothetical protein [Corynebacterium striatum]
MSRTSVDASTARTIRNLRRALHAERVRRFPPRSVQPGPNAITRMAGGALAVEGCRALIEENERSRTWVIDDFNRRGMAESAAAIADSYEDNIAFTDEDGHDFRFSARDGEISRYSVEHLGKEISAAIGDDDAREVTALSPAEVIEDLEAQDADPEAIDSYALAVGDSDVSPSDQLVNQLQEETSEELESPGNELADAAEQADEQVAEL